MTTVAKPQLSLREKAAILKENGVAVIDCLDTGWVDVDKTIYHYSPSQSVNLLRRR